jgi:hypothetical protein
MTLLDEFATENTKVQKETVSCNKVYEVFFKIDLKNFHKDHAA